VLLREAESESDHVVKPSSDAMPAREETGTRDEAALAKLSTEEREACVRPWADVAALLKKAEDSPK
jgi:hypothetical protein